MLGNNLQKVAMDFLPGLISPLFATHCNVIFLQSPFFFV